MTTIVDTPFDLYDVFINMIFGNQNWSYFFVFSLIVLSYICARYRLPNIITLALFVLYVVILAPFYQTGLVIVITLMGILLGWTIGRITTGST